MISMRFFEIKFKDCNQNMENQSIAKDYRKNKKEEDRN
jgi:hypothetical protein